jgi:hypothetical protein
MEDVMEWVSFKVKKKGVIETGLEHHSMSLFGKNLEGLGNKFNYFSSQCSKWWP